MPVTIKLKGVAQEFKSLDGDLNEFVNQATRSALFQTLGELKRTTPVDTGRARNSWVATTNAAEFRDVASNNLGIASSLLIPPPRDIIEQYYITNGVNYIDKLNAGSSTQAPARFIENAVMKYFEVSGLVYIAV